MSAQSNSGTTSAQSGGTSGGTNGGGATDHLSNPTRKRTGTVSTGVAIALAVILLLVGFGGGYAVESVLHKSSSSSTVTLTETGSSLLYPLLHYYWAPNFTASSGIVLSTASTGSGTGQTDSNESLVNIGGSDGYYTPAKAVGMLNVPVATSAQLIYYNLPGITAHLNLNGSILGEIYAGDITKWNNPLIAAANPTVDLPDNTIVPLKRADSSGDTFLFSSLCQLSLANWTLGYSNTAFSGTTWTGETGNSGMVSGLNSTPYSIAYVGISYEAAAAAEPNKLQYAALGDNYSLSAAGGLVASNYVLPNATTIDNDANLALTHLDFATSQLELSLILGGNYHTPETTLIAGSGGTNPQTGLPAYPDANFEYALVRTVPVTTSGSVVSSATLTATITFLEWAISYGNYNSAGAATAWLNAVNFVPLTPEVVGYDMQEIAQIQP